MYITYPNTQMPAPQGWQCPCCRRVYAPFMTMCTACGPMTPNLGQPVWANCSTIPFTVNGVSLGVGTSDNMANISRTSADAFVANNWTGGVVSTTVTEPSKRCNGNCGNGCSC